MILPVFDLEQNILVLFVFFGCSVRHGSSMQNW